MNLLETPPVPTLSDSRLSTRQEHLVQEVAGRRRNRRRAGLALGGGALVVGGVATALLVLAGPGTANAFCGLDAIADDASARPGIERRSDLRGCGGHTATGQDSGIGHGRDPSVARRHSRTLHTGLVRCKHIYHPHVCERPVDQFQRHRPTRECGSIGSQPVLPEAGQIAVDRLQAGSANDGQAYTVTEGSVGSGVTAATLVLSDGSDVVTTTGSGLFLAWWPGSAVVTSATVTTATGTTTQPISSSRYRRLRRHYRAIHWHRRVRGEVVVLSAARKKTVLRPEFPFGRRDRWSANARGCRDASPVLGTRIRYAAEGPPPGTIERSAPGHDPLLLNGRTRQHTQGRIASRQNVVRSHSGRRMSSKYPALHA